MRNKYKKLVLIVGAATALGLGAFPANSQLGDGLNAKKKVELKKHFPTKQLEKSEDVKWNHAPYNVGKCSLCHVSDDEEKPGEMRASVNTVCLSCHVIEKSYLKVRKVVHEPVEKDCGYCHNAHNSKYKHLLYKPMEELCTTCHVDQKKAMSSKTKHDPVTMQKQCANCHDSHAGNHEKLLTANEADLCVSCHGGKDKPVKDEKGRVLTDIKAVEKRKVKHEPFDKGRCSDCHDSHGSENVRLLVASHPSDFYAAYKDESYGLCYTCHEKDRITTEKTTTLTGFRDGERNLHYIHVVKPERGRSCRSCHDDHATENPHLVRSSVPYGNIAWELPLAYTETNNGGRCAKTCHDNQTYNNKGSRPKDVAAAYKKRIATEGNGRKTK